MSDKLTRQHWKIVFIAGMGFFTDAYDLFIIGVVTAILMPVWHLTIWQVAVLNGAALIAAAIGAVTFGWISDRLGRKCIYGYEVLLLFFGALLSASSTSFVWLLIWRVLVGFAVGGDYPMSAVVSSEHAGSKHRGFLVLMVFAMQAAGLIVGPFIASGLLLLDLPIEWTWRVLLGLGAIPAISVFMLRRNIAETSHFLEDKKKRFSGSVVVNELLSKGGNASKPRAISLKPKIFCCFRKTLFATATAWFLFDIAFYGNSMSFVLILKHLTPNASLVEKTLTTAIVFLVFAVPGYLAAAKYVDKIGRKRMQILGFSMMAVCYVIMALYYDQWQWFLAAFGVSFFFVNFGPNATTFLMSSESFPTSIRASAHGISAAAGKAGAFIGAFFMPVVLNGCGLMVTFFMVALICLLGVLTTLLLPEMAGKDLF